MRSVRGQEKGATSVFYGSKGRVELTDILFPLIRIISDSGTLDFFFKCPQAAMEVNAEEQTKLRNRTIMLLS